MRVVPESYQRAERKLYIRMMILIGFGVLLLAVSGFWLLIGGVALFAPVEPGDEVIGTLVIFVGGILPSLLALALFAKGALDVRKIWRFSKLALHVRGSHRPTRGSAACALGITDAQAERLLFDATVNGLIEDDPLEEPRSIDDDLVEETLAMPRQEFAWHEHATQAPPGDSLHSEHQTQGVRSALDTTSVEPEIRVGGRLGGFQGDLSRSLRGTVLNDTYHVEEPIGVGGMGAVYVARHVRANRRYAVKALLPDARFSEEAIRRFKREAAAASALGHRGIVAIHDFNVTPDGLHYLVSELLEGMTLEDRLEKEGTLKWHAASTIIVQVAEALQVAHQAGILHRDLKPGNIYLDLSRGRPERAVILDFGLAKQMDDVSATKITITGTVVGTPLYMSPEQACSEKLDVRADVYALGAVFYELLTGAPPFVADTIAGIYNRLLTEQAIPPSEVSPHQLPDEVDVLMTRALAKNPDERFQTALALAKAVEEVEETWDAPRDTSIDPL